MAQSKEPATNERIVRLLEEIKEQLPTSARGRAGWRMT